MNTVVKIESGVNKNPTIETLTKLASALQIDVNDLLRYNAVDSKSFREYI
ncbi:MAG: helix-turn-helix transcriptional regulator [Candidatus Kerfeldbacteria bacterium]|nr:helix-turn-helix transcriptional regulator [Candidatus Kerfeldbacteria bacterium]